MPEVQLVELTHFGGWKQLNDIQWSALLNNFLNLIKIVILALILWRVW